MVVEGRDEVIPIRVGVFPGGRHVGVVFVEVGQEDAPSASIGIVPVQED